MEQIFAILKVASAATALVFGLKLIDAYWVAVQEAAAGNMDVVSGYIHVGVMAVVGVAILAAATPGR